MSLTGRGILVRPGELLRPGPVPDGQAPVHGVRARPATSAPSTRFSSPIPRTRHMRQLTFYPEEVQLLQDKDVLQIQNRFGVFRSETEFRNIAPIAMFPSFVTGSQVQSGTIAPMQTSPDGRYLLYLRTRSPAYGDLTLLNVATGVADSDLHEGRALPRGAARRLVARFTLHRLRQGLGPVLLSPLPSCRRTASLPRSCGTSAPAPWRMSAGARREPCTTSRGSSSTRSIRTSFSRAPCTRAS